LVPAGEFGATAPPARPKFQSRGPPTILVEWIRNIICERFVVNFDNRVVLTAIWPEFGGY